MDRVKMIFPHRTVGVQVRLLLRPEGKTIV